EDAKTYLFKKLKIDEEIKDSLATGYAYLSLGELYLQSGKLDSALLFENKTNTIGKALNNKLLLAYSDSYIGSILSKQGVFDDAYNILEEALQIAKSIDDKETISMIYFNLGEVCVKLQRFPDASNFYAQSLDIAKKINDKKKIMQGYLALTHYDSVSGNLNAVLPHYMEYITYRDSVFNVSNARKIENEKISYDFENQRAIAKEESERRIQRQKILRDMFIGGFGLALIFSLVFFRQRVRIGKEKKRSDDLLLNILPAETAEELKAKGSTIAKDYDMVTVLFTDFKNFTKASESLNAQELVNEINYCYSEFDRIVTTFGIEKIKTIGDGYMAAGGLPVKNSTNAIDAVKAALAIRDFIENEKQKRMSEGKPFFEIRIGMHTGHVVAGVVGIKKFAYDIWGDTVNIASRMESSGEPGKVNISGATYEYVKDQFKCTYRGKVLAKNKGEIDMYFVES
ncbi:MAG TPA: adenylate/guanylate cyclase domain-containing protein, partial [Bacteroidia bacterium]|nr:adenylate/guanylate cyclase domain-containing protein [Bacteroidia bacterium]